MNTSSIKPTPKPNPRVGVAVFVYRARDDPHFILGKRKGSHGAGTLALPGGHLEYNESFEECAAREIAEETGLETEGLEFVTATNDVFEKEGKHYVTIFMKAFAKAGNAGQDAPEPKLLEPDKCEEWVWRSFRQMRLIDQEDGGELFLPLKSLLAQRKNVCASLEEG